MLAALGLGLTLYLLAHLGVGDLFHSVRVAGWGLALLLPFHLLPLALDSAGWRVLLAPLDPARRASASFLLWAAAVREAITRLLPVVSVGGDLLGIRLVMQRGLSGPIAAASVAVEILVSLIAQYLLTVVAVVTLIGTTQSSHVATLLAFGLLVILPILAAVALLLRNARFFERLAAMVEKLLGSQSFVPTSDSAATLDRHIRQLLRDPARLAVAILWQFAGMAINSGELWLASHLIGHPLSVPAAVALEGLTQGASYAAFFIPAGLGVQEAGFVFFGQLLGVPGDTAIALSLIRRAREVVFGLPVLLSWQWLEIRYAKRANASKSPSVEPDA